MSFFGINLFGKTPTPEERVREWKLQLRKEERVIQRAITDIEREEANVIREIKVAAKKGENNIARMLAKQIVQSRKAKERLYNSKAELNSVSMTLSQQLATIKVAGCLAKSAKVMESMNKLINIEQISSTMNLMAREMEKAGLIEEMMGEAISDGEDLEEEVEAEVEKVYNELTAGLVSVPSQPLPAPEKSRAEVDLQNRVSALNS